MIRQTMIAAAFLAVPALAKEVPAVGETTIPRMSAFLEWLPDGDRGLYIRGDTGRWYHARLAGGCARLGHGGRMRFNASPSDRFDRFSSIRIDGWRCQVDSVTASAGPPPRRHR